MVKAGQARGMLQAMQQPVPSASPSAASNFAGLLAAFTAPSRKRNEPWNADDLGDDIATLSYERALQKHGRFQPADSDEQSLETSHQQIAPAVTQGLRVPAVSAASCSTPEDHLLKEESDNARHRGGYPTPDRKCSSITIRLSKADCDQLRRRAAESGLTVSAYLRSCTIEADQLRSQVKEALAQLQASPVQTHHDQEQVVRRGWMPDLRRFLSKRRAQPSLAEA
jgi:hypothetical protein